jgi:site-specific recombinase XerC
LRKAYAVDLYRRTNDLKKVQEALNHDNELVTILYAMADILNSRAQKKK